MRVRVIFAALTLLLAGSLSANSVSLKATGSFEGTPKNVDRTSDTFFSEAFVNRDSSNRPFHLALNFGSGQDFRWEFQFMAPEGKQIEPGVYVNPSRKSLDRKGAAFMSMVGANNPLDEFRCDENDPVVNRSFTITQLDLLPEVIPGKTDVKQFALSFVEKCAQNSLTGTILFGVSGLPEGGGGDDGGGDTTTPPAAFQIQFPPQFDVEPVVLTNSSSKTIDFQTLVDSTFNADLNLSVSTDALEDENFHASLASGLIAAPGSGNGKVTLTTGPLTFPRVYQVTLNAASADGQSFSRSFLVQVMCDPPFILGIDQPKSITAANGTQVTLEVKPSGSGPFFYQWYKGYPGMTRNPVLAANESKLIFTTRETQTYWVRVSNACGTVNSNPVTVTTTGSLAGPARRRS
jgi:hypothetical protein